MHSPFLQMPQFQDRKTEIHEEHMNSCAQFEEGIPTAQCNLPGFMALVGLGIYIRNQRTRQMWA